MFKKQVKCAGCGFLGTLVLGLDDVVRWQEIHPEQRSDLLEIYKDAPFHIGCMRGQDHLIAGAPQPGKPINREKLLRNSLNLVNVSTSTITILAIHLISILNC